MRTWILSLTILLLSDALALAQPYYREPYQEPYAEQYPRQRPPVVCFVDPGLERYRSYPWCEIAGYRRVGARCSCPSFGQTQLPGTVGPR
jgi:hypothetical protein